MGERQKAGNPRHDQERQQLFHSQETSPTPRKLKPSAIFNSRHLESENN